ncbi:MAG TPA: HIT family protein [Candidatus Saccharimonadales bacterium]|nr:HIT family protein [Candidatus Saccharimonadales bacterium]
MATLWTKIINGEIPSYKVYEDELTFAFLNIYPVQPGHLMVIPKVEVDHLEDLNDEYYFAVMKTVRMLMKHLREVTDANRICLKVEGWHVPHAHVHLIPCKEVQDFYGQPDETKEPDHKALADMAKRIALT